MLHINTGSASTGTIELVDLAGKVMYSKTFTGTSVTIDLSEFANGVYFVTMYTTEGKTVARMIKD